MAHRRRLLRVDAGRGISCVQPLNFVCVCVTCGVSQWLVHVAGCIIACSDAQSCIYIYICSMTVDACTGHAHAGHDLSRSRLIIWAENVTFVHLYMHARVERQKECMHLYIHFL